MWLMLNDCFFSIVAKDCARDELMVRARRPGDLEKVFPETKGKVKQFTKSDYHYRAAIKKDSLKTALCGEIDRITYSNFKSSVTDHALHLAYMKVWTAMAALQPSEPYSGHRRQLKQADDGFFDFHTPQGKEPKGKFHRITAPKRSLKKGQ